MRAAEHQTRCSPREFFVGAAKGQKAHLNVPMGRDVKKHGGGVGLGKGLGAGRGS